MDEYAHLINDNLKRVADALEEILRLVKTDQEKMEKRRLREPDDVTGELWK